jgi:hypothetical protein
VVKLCVELGDEVIDLDPDRELLAELVGVPEALVVAADDADAESLRVPDCDEVRDRLGVAVDVLDSDGVIDSVGEEESLGEVLWLELAVGLGVASPLELPVTLRVAVPEPVAVLVPDIERLCETVDEELGVPDALSEPVIEGVTLCDGVGVRLSV